MWPPDDTNIFSQQLFTTPNNFHNPQTFFHNPEHFSQPRTICHNPRQFFTTPDKLSQPHAFLHNPRHFMTTAGNFSQSPWCPPPLSRPVETHRLDHLEPTPPVLVPLLAHGVIGATSVYVGNPILLRAARGAWSIKFVPAPMAQASPTREITNMFTVCATTQ